MIRYFSLCLYLVRTIPEFIPDAEFKGLDHQNGYIKVILFYDYESD